MSYIIWTTTRCNLNCKYCYEGSDKLDYIMDISMAKKVLDYICSELENKTEDNLLISFHGGEPFLNFNVIKFLVKEFRKKYSNVLFTSTTNATLLTDDMISFIVDEIPDITVSLDGLKVTHDKTRPFRGGKGSYDIAIANGNKLLQQLPYLRVRMTFDSSTVLTLAQDVKHLLELGYSIIVAAPNASDPLWNEEHMKILEEQIRKLNFIKQQYNNSSISLCEPIKLNCKSKCMGGIKSKHIYPNGDIYPCIMSGGMEEFIIGNVQSGVDAEKLNQILKYSESSNAACQDCKLIRSCDGERCKIVNKITNGDYFSPVALTCRLNNIRYSFS